MIETMVVIDDKLTKAIAAFEKAAREEREKKTVGQLTLTLDLAQGGINGSKIGVVRNIK